MPHDSALPALDDEREERLWSTSVALLPRQTRWLDARAAAEGLKRSDIIRRAIELYIRVEERSA